MRAGAVDIHHHFVPEQVIEEARQYGKPLGVEVSEEENGAIHFSFGGGPKCALQHGLTDEMPRIAMMDESKIALAAIMSHSAR